MSAYIVGAIIVIGLVLAVMWKLSIWPFKKTYKKVELPITFPSKFAEYHHTTGLANCNFEDPLKPGDWEKIEPIIEMGIRNCIKGYLPQWNNARGINDFLICFIKPTATNMDGSPALLVNGIQSAGTMLGYSASFSTPLIVLPQQANWDHLVYLMYSVWHEGEHFGEWLNDKGWFWNYVGAGDVHPHRPIENPEMPLVPVSLMSKPVLQPSCGNFAHLKK